MDIFEKVADAYVAEIDRLFALADERGIVDQDFTPEKRAAYRNLEKTAGPEIMEMLDQLTLEELRPIEKFALFSGLGKMAGWALDLASAAKRVAKAPSKGLMDAFARKGVTGEAAGKLLSQRAEMGPVAYGRMRRTLGRPTVGAAPAAPAASGKPHSLMGELRSGLVFGGGFGLAQRLLTKKEDPEVQIG